MKKLKENNKGFSLVELIVVMAIMAILAVTLTPRLTQYIDKARQTNDREIPNAVFTVTRLSLLDTAMQDAVASSADTTRTLPVAYDADINWTAGVNILTQYYDQVGDTYTLKTDASDPALPYVDLLAADIIETLGDSFRLQSKLADEHAANIIVKVVDSDPSTTATDYSELFSVAFSYKDTTAGSYTMDTATIGD
jgi:prepilin-type N-terminal cleavage/methylation domain-containing protein